MDVKHLTQKPARDVHLDNNRSATARVGRRSKGTDAPMISPLRLCDSSAGDKGTGNVDMFGTQGVTAQRIVRRFKNAVGDAQKPGHEAIPFPL